MARGSQSVRSSTGSAAGRRRRRPTPSSRLPTTSPASSRRQPGFATAPTGPSRQSGSSHGQGPGTGLHAPSDPCSDMDCDQESGGCVPHEVIMALDMRDGASMGCAFFTASSGALSLFEDVPMADENVAEHFITHVQPTTLLVSARAPEHLLDFLDKAAAPDGEPDGSPCGFILRALASSDFFPSSARDRLVTLQVDTSPGPSAVFSAGGHVPEAVDVLGHRESENIRLMRLGSLVDLESSASVSCAGAVLAELHRRRSTACSQGANPVFHVSSIQTLSLANYVFVNAETLRSLQIVHSELHPNSQSWGPDAHRDGAKESLSIYGLFHHLASTPQGRVCLRKLMLRPTVDMAIITKRQRVITLLLRPDNAEKTKQATMILRKIKDVRVALSQLRRGVDHPTSGRSVNRGVWATLRRFAAQTLRLRELIGTLSGSEGVDTIHEVWICVNSAPEDGLGYAAETMQLVARIHQSALVIVGDSIDKTIDFDQSESRRRSSVKAGIDAHLDELKRRYDGMGSFLTEVVDRINQTLPEWACRYIRSCIFLPQLGFLTVVELDAQTGNGRYEGEGAGNERWEKLFTADGAVCYKNRYMKELDEQYGDMYCEIGDREVEIIHRLATAVLKHDDALVAASDACGDFDCMLALAIGAEKYNWTAPQMTGSNVVRIENGRHPLQELVVPSFVPNDCDLSGGHGASGYQGPEQASALILTGPNHSGKSIYLKQVAVIVYLAHIGSFVPAGRAIIGITDKILTRISTRESMCRAESAFAIDLRQVAQAMRCCSRMSLVLIDEFGKGTNPDDGAGLLAAVVAHFLCLDQDTPRLLVATHFHELFEGGYLRGHKGLVLGHMDVKTDWEADRVEDQVTYLFKLARGHSSSSFGGRCAALNGVPGAIVDRAEAISLLLSRNEDLGSSCARLSLEEKRRLKVAEAVARRFLQADLGGDAPRDRQAALALKADLCDMLLAGTQSLPKAGSPGDTSAD